MPDKNMRIVTNGELREGFTRETVAANLASLCKYGPDKIARVFSGETFVFKYGLDEPNTRRYLDALTRVGIVCRLERTQPRPLSMVDSVPVQAEQTRVTCPKCGTEQPAALCCVNCQVVMEKYRQRMHAQQSPFLNSPSRTTEESTRRFPVTVILLLLVVGGVFAFFYSSLEGSSISDLKSAFTSDAEVRKELGFKRAKLAAYEKAIVDITSKMESIEENAPILPCTGEKATITITKDPRDELEQDCDVLREEIRALEAKLKD